MAERAYHAERPKPEDYAPYHTFPEFWEGVEGYASFARCPYSEDSVAAQAWDRGQEYMMRMTKE
jgi:hypothetical protein